MLRGVDEDARAPLTTPVCCCPGPDDDFFGDREGGLLRCNLHFRTRALLVAAVYATYGVLSIVSLSVAAAADTGSARGFAIGVALVCPALHFCTSLLGMLTPDGRRALEIDLVALVVVGDWLLSAALAVASCGVHAAGGDLANVDLGYCVVANVLALCGQLGCIAKTAAWLDPAQYDPSSGRRAVQEI